jgi:deoxyribodipyrimidine photo-lyase
MHYSIFWHRRDLRIADNAGLYKALKSGFPVQPIFIFDRQILDQLPRDDKRVAFIYRQLERLRAAYLEAGAVLQVYYGTPEQVWKNLTEDGNLKAVYTNRDYEPYALQRDELVQRILADKDIPFFGAKDHVIFEKNEVLKDDGKPYTVFTPYSRKWKAKLTPFYLQSYPTLSHLKHLRKDAEPKWITPEEMHFSVPETLSFPSNQVADSLLANYHETRDLPAVNGTSRLSVHLRFGTISIRELARQAEKCNATFLNELIWRDFYHMIVYHFPHSATNAFKPQYDRIQWEHNEAHFQAWCEGKTGYPLVDAGMRELNATGFMHNRVRMVTASFLTKHLLIDWRLGERYFAEKLLDFDLAANVGGWQWAASSGCDAAPYFRVFNPSAQQEKFDKQLNYIKRWVPEYGTNAYPAPIVDHKQARERVLNRYAEALK